MKNSVNLPFPRNILLALVILALAAAPASAADYPSLEGVQGLDTMVDYALGSPQAATVVFPAIREIYQDPNVKALPREPRTVIIFHGEAVKLLSTDRSGFDKKDHEALDQVAEMIRRFHKDGVRMEVCMYAVKVFGVDPATLVPEIARVGNGFISAIGYQQKGYGMVVVP